MSADSFGGPTLKIVSMLGAPLLVQWLWAACELNHCHMQQFALDWLAADHKWAMLFVWPTAREWTLLLLWFAAQFACRVALPGRRQLGYVQKDGTRLWYVLNGAACLSVTMLGTLLGFYCGVLDGSLFDKRLRAIVTAFQLFAFALVLALGAKAKVQRRGESSGSMLTDYFFGYELNPRFGSGRWAELSDVKFFLETHALIMWLQWDVYFAVQQYERFGSLSSAMMLTLCVHFVYVLHHFHDESFVLGVMDFTSENLGWMLTWGNILFVGCFFTAPTMYLAHHHASLPPLVNTAILALAVAGLYMFSSSNFQKHRFKQNPSAPIWGERPRAMATKRGTKLLLSGWWGVGRKMNYTGDLMLALCHGLPSGLACIAPHLYFIYLFALLLHRAQRDEAWCREKYGDDWDRYCEKVPYQMIPGIY